MGKKSTAKPFYICMHCGSQYAWSASGRVGRPPVTCSIQCAAEHRKAKDRARYAANLERNRLRRLRGSPYLSIDCSIDDCQRKAYSKGMCDLHYNRVRLTGDPGPAGLKKRPAGEGYVDPETGYVYSYSPKRRRQVLKHRLVIEMALGRELMPWENVHHRNGIRSDNRSANLEIWVTPQPAGQRPSDLLRWCDENRELIEQDAEWNRRIGATEEGRHDAAV